MSTITIDEIEILFRLIIDKLKSDDFSEIVPRIDEYWIITSDEWDNFKEPPVPAVGSLNEDIAYLKRALEENLVSSYSDFDRLATVLRAISEIEAPTR